MKRSQAKRHGSTHVVHSSQNMYLSDVPVKICGTRARLKSYVTREAIPTLPISSRSIFFGFGRVTLFFFPLSVYFGPASRSNLPALGPRHARNFLGFTPALFTRDLSYECVRLLCASPVSHA